MSALGRRGTEHRPGDWRGAFACVTVILCSWIQTVRPLLPVSLGLTLCIPIQIAWTKPSHFRLGSCRHHCVCSDTSPSTRVELVARICRYYYLSSKPGGKLKIG